MRLLVTNDDGADSSFLRALVLALAGAGHDPFVVAPRREQSWIGAAKSRSRPVHACREDRDLGCPTWVVDGTPSDCVNIALGHLVGRELDAVVSGMNVGLNTTLGFILASGTVAGAWEGALHGLPALACSQEVTEEDYDALKANPAAPSAGLAATLEASSLRAAELATRLLAECGPRRFIVHNLNFPIGCSAFTPVRRTVPARVLVPGLFTPAAADGTHRLMFTSGEDLSPSEPLTDRAAVAAGAISHSILDYTALGR